MSDEQQEGKKRRKRKSPLDQEIQRLQRMQHASINRGNINGSETINFLPITNVSPSDNPSSSTMVNLPTNPNNSGGRRGRPSHYNHMIAYFQNISSNAESRMIRDDESTQNIVISEEENTKIVRIKIIGKTINQQELSKIHRHFDNDEVAVVLADIFHKEDMYKFSVEEITGKLANKISDKVRVYSRKGDKEEYQENETVGMKIGDAVKLMKNSINNESTNEDCVIECTRGKRRKFKLKDWRYYILDEHISGIPHKLEEFHHSFKIPQLLCYSSDTLEGYIPESDRPDMGPLMFITTSGPITSAHLDGKGTIDSIHCCIEGRNEVIIFRRMEYDMSLKLMAQLFKVDANTAERIYRNQAHDRELFEYNWPSNKEFSRYEKQGFCPVRLVLKEGEALHIGRGRIHCFRKMSAEDLTEDDCHYELRQKNKLNKDCEFLSIAWDMQRLPYNKQSLKRDIVEIYKTTQSNRKLRLESLAKHEYGIIALADYLSTTKQLSERQKTLCDGIEETFIHIVNHHEKVYQKAKNTKHVEIAKVGEENDPINCGICDYELSNFFFDCKYCKIKFCSYCFMEDAYVKHGKHSKHYGKNGAINMKYHYRSLEQELDIAKKLQVINRK